jgi:hypothetical protein
MKLRRTLEHRNVSELARAPALATIPTNSVFPCFRGASVDSAQGTTSCISLLARPAPAAFKPRTRTK